MMQIRKGMKYLNLLFDTEYTVKDVKENTVTVIDAASVEVEFQKDAFIDSFTSAYGLKDLAYEMYAEDWMQRINFERQKKARHDYYEALKDNPDLSFDDFIFENGYDGEIYACFDEFLDAEYQDVDYMKTLLSDAMLEEYENEMVSMGIVVENNLPYTVAEPNKYLVQSLSDDDVLCTSLRSAAEIISRIDMRDCSNEDIRVFRIDEFGAVEPLEIHGCWHDWHDPLYIKVTDKAGNVVFSGYGTDH